MMARRRGEQGEREAPVDPHLTDRTIERMRTLRMVALQDTVPLGSLLDQLDELEARPREAWSPRAEVQHQSIERTVIERVVTRASPAGVAIECALPVEIRTRWRGGRTTLSGLEHGGARLDLDGIWSEGTVVQLVTSETQIGVGIVGHVGKSVRVAFLKPRTATGAQRLHAFVRQAVRSRAQAR
jgi:hypothetical protein